MTVFLALFFAEVILEAGAKIQTALVVGLSLKNGLLGLLLLYVLFRKLRFKRLYYYASISKSIRAYGLYVLYAFLVTFLVSLLSRNQDQVISALLSWKGMVLDGFIGLLIFSSVMKNKADALRLIEYLIYVLSILGFLTLLETVFGFPLLFGTDDNSIRPNGPLGEPNQTAAVYAMLVPICFAFMLDKKKQWVFGPCLLLILATIFATGSRGGILAAAFALFIFLIGGQQHIRTTNKIKIIILTPFIFLASWYVVPAEIIDKLIARIFSYEEKGSSLQQVSAGRTYLWGLALDLWKESPIFGQGWNSFKFKYTAATHNTYLQVLSELGVFGLLTYLYVGFRSIKTPWKLSRLTNNRAEKLMFLAMIASISALAVAITFVNLYKAWLVVWMLIGAYFGFCNFWYRTRLGELKKKTE